MRVSSALNIFKIVSFSRYMLVLVGFTFAVSVLFLSDLNQAPILKSARLGIMDGLSPIFSATQTVNRAANGAFEYVSDFFSAFQRLDELKDQNQKLTRWKAVALSLLAENKALRNQVNVVPETFRPVVTARVLTYPANPSVHRIIIQAGTAQNVEEGQIVVTPKGVIGRVLESGTYVSEVLLITDGYSRIPDALFSPFTSRRSLRDQIIIWNWTIWRRMWELTGGMHVFTSGKGGIFPPGLYLGMTHLVDGHISIEPVMDWKDLDYVQILTQPHLTLED